MGTTGRSPSRLGGGMNLFTALLLSREEAALLWIPDPGFHLTLHLAYQVRVYRRSMERDVPLTHDTEGATKTLYFLHLHTVSYPNASLPSGSGEPMVSELPYKELGPMGKADFLHFLELHHIGVEVDWFPYEAQGHGGGGEGVTTESERASDAGGR